MATQMAGRTIVHGGHVNLIRPTLTGVASVTEPTWMGGVGSLIGAIAATTLAMLTVILWASSAIDFGVLIAMVSLP